MLTEAYLEPSQTSDKAFFTLVKPYFKNAFNSIEFPLSSVCYTTHLFVEKLTTLKTSEEKVFC